MSGSDPDESLRWTGSTAKQRAAKKNKRKKMSRASRRFYSSFTLILYITLTEPLELSLFGLFDGFDSRVYLKGAQLRHSMI